jgi:hypothetical protein
MILELTEHVFDLAELFQAALATEFSFFFRKWSLGGHARPWGWVQKYMADVEIFFKAIELKQVGEFKGADVAPAFADFPLKIANHSAQVLESEASLEPLIPLSFPVKAQAQALSGQLAIEVVGRGNLCGEL